MSSSIINNKEQAIEAIKEESIFSYYDEIADVDITDQVFDNVELIGVKFSNCSFVSCSFKGIKLYEATFNKVTFEDCDFSEAALEKSTLTSVFFNSCILDETEIEDSSCLEISFNDCIGAISFEATSLIDAEFNNCDMPHSDFCGTDLCKAEFYGCNITLSVMNSLTNLSGAILRDCDITEVDILVSKGLCRLESCTSRPFISSSDGIDKWSLLGVSPSPKRSVNSDTKSPSRDAYLLCSDRKLLKFIAEEVGLEYIRTL